MYQHIGQYFLYYLKLIKSSSNLWIAVIHYWMERANNNGSVHRLSTNFNISSRPSPLIALASTTWMLCLNSTCNLWICSIRSASFLICLYATSILDSTNRNWKTSAIGSHKKTAQYDKCKVILRVVQIYHLMIACTVKSCRFCATINHKLKVSSKNRVY